MKKTLAFTILLAMAVCLVLTLCACEGLAKVNINQKQEKCDQSLVLTQFANGGSITVTGDVYSVLMHESKTDQAAVYWTTNEKFVVTVTDGTDLVIKQTPKDPNAFNLVISDLVIVICIPESWRSCEVDLRTTTGLIQVEDLAFDALTAQVTTGAVIVEDVEVARELILSTTTGGIFADVDCNRAVLESTTGQITLEGGVKEDLTATATTGGINITCDAKVVKMKTTTGAIKFSIKAQTISANCTTGAISGKVKGNQKDYTIDAKVDRGSCNISNQTGDGTHSLTVSSETGSVKISFAD